MIERLKKIREDCLHRRFGRYRQDVELSFAEEFSKKGYSVPVRSVMRYKLLLEAEKPIVFAEERIAITRTIKKIPSIYTEEEWKALNEKYECFQDYYMCNIITDYGYTIERGLGGRLAEIDASMERVQREQDQEGIEFLGCAKTAVLATMDFARRYQKEAERVGNAEVAEAFRVIADGEGAHTFQQALQFLRLLNFTIWFNIKYLIPFGRFDQYMYPFYEKDIQEGRLTKEEAFDLVQEFFLAANRDSDLYYGIQVGDNGQSMVLGERREDGTMYYNDLVFLCIDACRENNLIDPKINLRVGKTTPLDLYIKGSELTKIGLGFPQYCNDDVVIPALIAMGYEKEDAENYGVAACWEFIIPGTGMDLPNLDAVNFAKLVNDAIHTELPSCKTFEDFLEAYEKIFREEIDRLVKRYHYVHVEPCPWQSVLMKGCVEKARDFTSAAKYHNYGLHGAGISTGVDAMTTVKKLVFDEKKITPEELIHALDTDFADCPELRNQIIQEVPKMGHNEEYVDSLAVHMMKLFSDAMRGKKNALGGIFRPGTGTAQFYIWYTRNLPATADGRKAYAPLPADFSPSLTATLKGPLSTVKSFTKPDLQNCCNGGPLTIELHDTVFRNDEGIMKTAMLVKSFVDLGGHQLQLNTVNREQMLDAQEHPENHPNLIVRVWGWSGYFVELDKEYQDQIISLTEFTFS